MSDMDRAKWLNHNKAWLSHSWCGDEPVHPEHTWPHPGDGQYYFCEGKPTGTTPPPAMRESATPDSVVPQWLKRRLTGIEETVTLVEKDLRDRIQLVMSAFTDHDAQIDRICERMSDVEYKLRQTLTPDFKFTLKVPVAVEDCNEGEPSSSGEYRCTDCDYIFYKFVGPKGSALWSTAFLDNAVGNRLLSWNDFQNAYPECADKLVFMR